MAAQWLDVGVLVSRFQVTALMEGKVLCNTIEARSIDILFDSFSFACHAHNSRPVHCFSPSTRFLLQSSSFLLSAASLRMS